MELKKIFGGLVFTVFCQLLYAQSDTISIRLYGNASCKSQLEELAMSFKNITSANYDTLKGRMLVQYSGDFNKGMFVFNFASKGYDAENVRAKDILYNALPEACRYIRKPEEVIRD